MYPNAFHVYFDFVLLTIVVSIIVIFGLIFYFTRYCKYKQMAAAELRERERVAGAHQARSFWQKVGLSFSDGVRLRRVLDSPSDKKLNYTERTIKVLLS